MLRLVMCKKTIKTGQLLLLLILADWFSAGTTDPIRKYSCFLNILNNLHVATENFAGGRLK